jgi:hypothetical protein
MKLKYVPPVLLQCGVQLKKNNLEQLTVRKL